MISRLPSPTLASRAVFVFPGQGSQSVGMAASLVDRDRASGRNMLLAADEALGFELSSVCVEGSAEDIAKTELAQPAILLTSLLLYDLLRERIPRPAAVAGHSLGEYTALVVAGVLNWDDALRLVRHRGLLMAAAARKRGGGMMAILGLNAEVIDELCRNVSETPGEFVEIANLNAPQQTVVSGADAGLERLAAAIDALGAHHVRLQVAGPFHSSLMADVVEPYRAALDAVEFSDPQIPIYSNVTAEPVLDAKSARESLLAQVCGTVRWSDTLKAFDAENVTALIEVGPGKVLTSLAAITIGTIPVASCFSSSEVEGCVRLLSEHVPGSCDELQAEVASATRVGVKR